ncbi:MAG: DUF6279 family lipoprotein [Burkholderiaceae bacterium]|nr:DUF6279 family lipoprotein [Burkholderiaceae bacterium]
MKWLLLAAAALALAACSAARLGYSQGHELAFWWLDGYAGFNGEQSPQVRAALREWFAWHRNTQLPDYADLLAQAQRDVLAPTTPDAVCRWFDAFGERVDVALDQARPRLAEVALALTPQQIDSIEQRIAKSNDEFRDEFLQRDTARRQRDALKRTVDRFEDVYGRLDRAQRERVAQWVGASPFNPERWFAERQLRQQDLLATLRELQALPTADRTPARAEQAVAGLVERFTDSPRADYRDYQRRLRAYNCDLVARLHNDTTPAQRRAAQAKGGPCRSQARAPLNRRARS